MLVCTYEYDAWGNLTSAKNANGAEITSQNHIAFLNPIRYRGYYYDSEIGMYYLQSRYYDPDTGRFINADGYITTGQGVLSYNMFAYCLNNPVMMVDYDGELPEWIERIINWVKDLFSSEYDVPLYKQKGPMCWAYCTVMVEDCYYGITKTEEEADERARQISSYKYGADDWERGGRPSNLVEINNLSLWSLAINLKIHGPLYVAYAYYDEKNERHGHAVIITRIDLIDKTVYTNNPWGDQNVQSYDDFMIGIPNSDNDYVVEHCFYYEWLVF